MIYAKESDRVFITSNEVRTKRKPSKRAEHIKAFYDTHIVRIHIDPITKAGTAVVIKKAGDE